MTSTQKREAAIAPLIFGEDKVRALFLLSGITAAQCFEVANGYWPRHEDYAEVRARSPWWLVRTAAGDLISIGWRKRVLSIDWSATQFAGIITPDNVSKGEDFVHAWGYAKAVEYLAELGNGLRNLETVKVRGSSVPVLDLMAPAAPAGFALQTTGSTSGSLSGYPESTCA